MSGWSGGGTGSPGRGGCRGGSGVPGLSGRGGSGLVGCLRGVGDCDFIHWPPWGLAWKYTRSPVNGDPEGVALAMERVP
jgi:hypothetical protein